MIEVFAPAKINLGLSVTGRQPNGYHDIHTVFASLDVGDWIRIYPDQQELELEVTGSDLAATKDNLVYRAAEKFFEATQISPSVKIALEKNLPLAAGLGGGSSDAASTLLGLQKMFKTAIDLQPIALSLGADVPYFLQGGIAEADGIGENLKPWPNVLAHVVLVNPGIHVSAGSAYQGLQLSDFDSRLDVKAVLEAINQLSEPPYWNTLEKPILTVEPKIADLKRSMKDSGLFGVMMSGSGSTVFGLAKSVDERRRVFEKLKVLFSDYWMVETQIL